MLKNQEEESKIIIVYVDVRGVDNSLIPEIAKQVEQEIGKTPAFKNNQMSIIVIPILSNTRIECINPKYITDSELVGKHELLMKELHEHLSYQIEQLKVIKDSSEEEYVSQITKSEEISDKNEREEQ